MLLERTPAVVEVMNLHLHVLRVAERHEFLLNRIPGEGVADTQDADNDQYGTNELQASFLLRRTRQSKG